MDGPDAFAPPPDASVGIALSHSDAIAYSFDRVAMYSVPLAATGVVSMNSSMSILATILAARP